MNKFSTILLLLLFMLCVLPGCTSDVIDTPEYKGKHIVIGIIGEPPTIREGNVSFKKMTFTQLKDLHSLSEYDAVFITKENLPEAAGQEYAKIYKSARLPFFFIQSKKSYLPFTDEELSYDEVPDLSSDTYATGFFQNHNKIQHWGYGLYNDKLSSSNIEDVYTRIFETIESIAST
ncbi:hypothetical protein [Paenibacillus sabinae]|uniref:Putative lipoprotein n=1 Tax=Paenibacillus sabinae T27 TaxID=1268072 RepID=X4ZNM9_9BACL|nr:hypothetical protein [Paenibacillus sabinae]AHV98792.1 putative lipoprotein [Paenibacillus sabinae T27]